MILGDLPEGARFRFDPHYDNLAIPLCRELKDTVVVRGVQTGHTNIEVLSETGKHIRGCFPERRVIAVEEEEEMTTVPRYVYKTLSRRDEIELDFLVSTYVTEMAAKDYDFISVSPYTRTDSKRAFTGVMMVKYERM